MAGTFTKIADVIVPEIFTKYVIDRTAEQSKLVQSGIITSNPVLNELVSGGGKTINMPKWRDLTGESQVMDDENPILADKIHADKDVAVLLIRAHAWASHELAGALAGDDPMAAITQLVVNWWLRDEQRILMSILNGVFASPSMLPLTLDRSTVSIGADVVLDGKQLLGDASDQLTAICMHSATYTSLQKQGAIVMTPNQPTNIGPRQEISFPTYLGYRVIIDDGMPVTTGVYTSYLFASGVIARGEGVPVSLTPTEIDRDSAMSTDYLFNRRAFVLHPMGVMWKGSSTKPTPSNAELATGANWDLVTEVKKMGIVKLTHKL